MLLSWHFHYPRWKVKSILIFGKEIKKEWNVLTGGGERRHYMGRGILPHTRRENPELM